MLPNAFSRATMHPVLIWILLTLMFGNNSGRFPCLLNFQSFFGYYWEIAYLLMISFIIGFPVLILLVNGVVKQKLSCIFSSYAPKLLRYGSILLYVYALVFSIPWILSPTGLQLSPFSITSVRQNLWFSSLFLYYGTSRKVEMLFSLVT